jgi:preprotein translocase subunit SecG
VITILLVILLVIAVAMIGTVLIQRSEGGALGIGGGGQGGGLMSARGSANLLSRATAVLAFLFISVCLILAVLTGGERKSTSVVEGEAAPAAAGEAESSGPVLPESAGELLVIPDREPAQTPMEDLPAAPVIPDAGDEFLVIPDDSTDSWDPGASESPALPATPGAEAVPSLPDVDLPPVPDDGNFAPAGAAPEPPNPADSGGQPAAPLLPSAD